MNSCCLQGARERLKGHKMASQQLCLRFIGLAALLTLTTLRDVSSDSHLQKILVRRNVPEGEHAPPKTSVAIPASKAEEFLVKLSRTKRNIWDRTRPDVQQWISQFMQMGFDQQKLETDLQYWMDYARSHDQGRQHHYDENAPIGPRSSYRHGADVNYDNY